MQITNVVRTARALGQVALAASPWVPAPKPHSAAGVDAAFLEETVAAAYPGAHVDAISDVGGNTGTTDRRQLDVQWNEVGRQERLPERLFVKSTPLGPKNRTMVAALDMGVNEVLFYERARPLLSKSIAPKVHAAHAGVGARHLLLMEDISARGGRLFKLADECELSHASGVMHALAELHATFWNSPQLSQDLNFAVKQFSRPGFGLLMRQFRSVRAKVVNSNDWSVPNAVREMVDIVNRHDRKLYEEWERGPMTLIHGDSHLGNTYQNADGSSGLLDWQVVQQAPGLREVSYFLTHSAPTELRRTHQDDLVRTYLQGLEEFGVLGVPTPGQAWEQIRTFAFDAWDSAAICLVWPGLQDPANVTAAVSRANATVEDWNVAATLRNRL